MNNQQEFNARLSEEAAPRREQIVALHDSGLSFREISRLYKISRQRAQQIYYQGKAYQVTGASILPHPPDRDIIPIITIEEEK